MRCIFGGLVAGVLGLAMASGARAQDAGLYQMYAPMTYGSISTPMNYTFAARYPGYTPPYGYGPQNNAFTNTGLGSFVNGDDYAAARALATPTTAGYSYAPATAAPAPTPRATRRAQPLRRMLRRR